MKKLVSIHAIIARLNRKLSKESKKLLMFKPRLDNGDSIVEYAIVDLKTNAIINYQMASEMQEYARGLGCLAGMEEVSID
jgi:hypothetical protein